jgi:chitodextrinase
MRKQPLALSLALGALLLITGMVRACGLDGVPSLSINGRLVQVNLTPPVQGQLASWASFVAPGVYRAGQTVQLQEVRSLLLTTLPPSAFRTPWRWTFGDGTGAQGLIVRHRYRHRGTYVIGVQTLLVNGQLSAWYLFDSARIQVR